MTTVTGITSCTVKTYTVDIEEGEVRAVPYAGTGRRYRVERVTVVKQDGNLSKVTLGGSVIKKDGSNSANYASEWLFGHRDWPEWLPSIVKGLA